MSENAILEALQRIEGKVDRIEARLTSVEETQNTIVGDLREVHEFRGRVANRWILSLDLPETLGQSRWGECGRATKYEHGHLEVA